MLTSPRSCRPPLTMSPELINASSSSESVCKKITVALQTRRDGIVPFAVENVRAQLDGGKLLLAHLDSFRVLADVQLALNAQAGSRGGGSDKVDDDFMADQRLASPVLRDEGKQPMLDLVPLAGSRREVTDRDLQPGFVGQLLQLQFPQPHSRPVAPSAVRRDQKLSGIGVHLPTHHAPPSPDALDRERRCVKIGPHADPACILAQIVNSIGDVFLLPEIVHLDRFGVALRPPLTAPILVVPYLFFFLRVTDEVEWPFGSFSLVSKCVGS